MLCCISCLLLSLFLFFSVYVVEKTFADLISCAVFAFCFVPFCLHSFTYLLTAWLLYFSSFFSSWWWRRLLLLPPVWLAPTGKKLRKLFFFREVATAFSAVSCKKTHSHAQLFAWQFPLKGKLWKAVFVNWERERTLEMPSYGESLSDSRWKLEAVNRRVANKHSVYQLPQWAVEFEKRTKK